MGNPVKTFPIKKRNNSELLFWWNVSLIIRGRLIFTWDLEDFLPHLSFVYIFKNWKVVMGTGTRVGSIFCCSGQSRSAISLVLIWIWKISPKNINFFSTGQKISSGRVQGSLTSYLLQVKSMLGLLRAHLYLKTSFNENIFKPKCHLKFKTL